MKIRKIAISLILIFTLLWSFAACASAPASDLQPSETSTPTETTPYTVDCEEAYATILTASDFQDNGVFLRYKMFLDLLSADGCPTPDCVLFGGDYNILAGVDPDNNIGMLMDKLTASFPDFSTENAVFVQGNHDNSSSLLAQTGAHDFGNFVVYVINEDDFPSVQKPETVEKAVQGLDKYLAGMVSSGDYRPVLVATHVPLHHNARCDNGCASYLVNVLNQYGQKLDILFFFGHNHSDTFDDYLGGSVNLIRPGETMRVQKPNEEYSETSTNFTNVTINFTYLNYGYVGYSNNTVTDSSTNVLTMGVIQLLPESIEITRYTTEGVYSHDSIPLKNTTAAKNAA